METNHILEKSKLSFYVHRTRYVIIIESQLSNGYMLWDYSGKEQHRIIIASSNFYAGGPITFDNELPISSDPEVLWINCKVTEIDFCNLVGTDFETIKGSYDKYIANWMSVLKIFSDNTANGY